MTEQDLELLSQFVDGELPAAEAPPAPPLEAPPIAARTILP